jgi:hypothetical protein
MNNTKNVGKVIVVDDYTVAVEVIHSVDKSYSRSVEPFGKKLFNNWLSGADVDKYGWRWTMVDSITIDDNFDEYIMTFEKRK